MLAGERHRLLAVLRLRHDLVPGALEEPAQVEPDDRLVLGDEDSHAGNLTSAQVPLSPPASSSVPPSSSRTSARTIDSPVPFASAEMPAPSSLTASTS